MRVGWNRTREHLGFLIVVVLLVFLLNLIPTLLRESLSRDYALLSFLVSLSALVLQAVTSMGLINISLRILRGMEVGVAHLFDCVHLVIKYLVGYLLFAGLVLLGLIPSIVAWGLWAAVAGVGARPSLLWLGIGAALAVPAVVLVLKFLFFSYAIVDKELGAVAALGYSSRITAGFKGELFVFGLMLVLLNVGGALALGVGLLVTLPMTMLATAHVYRTLGVRYESPLETVPSPAASPSLTDGEGI